MLQNLVVDLKILQIKERDKRADLVSEFYGYVDFYSCSS